MGISKIGKDCDTILRSSRKPPIHQNIKIVPIGRLHLNFLLKFLCLISVGISDQEFCNIQGLNIQGLNIQGLYNEDCCGGMLSWRT